MTLLDDRSSLRPPPQDPSAQPWPLAHGLAKATAFAALDDSTVVIGFFNTAALQVWDIGSRVKAPDLKGEGQNCLALAALTGGRVAAANNRMGEACTVEVFDARTGERLQQLPAHSKSIYGLGFSFDHLVAASVDGWLTVWSMDASGRVSY